MLSLSAISVQLDRHTSYGFNTINFFSYFTNLSNILFAIFLLATALVLLLGQRHSPLFDFIRGGSVMCMLVVGVVFSLLLRSEDLGTLLPWVNLLLHYLMPVIAVVNWLIVPPRTKITKYHRLAWLIFPLVYLAYPLILGHARHCYPSHLIPPKPVATAASGFMVLVSAYYSCSQAG